MPDREKVIKGLKCCVTMPDIYPRCEECPYADAEGTCANMNGLHRDALALLKAQEPVMLDVYPKPIYLCANCDAVILRTDQYKANYCHRCGQAVKWE